MRILVVGPDKAGKTTLVQSLSRVFGLNCRKAVRIPDPDERLRRALQWWFFDLPLTDDIIMDREIFPDDLVYEPLIEGKSSPLRNGELLFSRQAKKLNVLTLFVYADLSTIQQRYKQTGGDSYVPLDRIPKIVALYDHYLRLYDIPHIKINTSTLSLDQCLSKAAASIIHWYAFERK